MVRHASNQLPNNLPQLQNCIKRDPESYKDEFMQQLEHINALLDVRRLDPSAPDKHLEELLMFMAQVCHCFKDEMRNFPGQLIDLLRSHGSVLHQDVRLAMCKALILIRNKGLINLTDILDLFVQLSTCHSKYLRSFLRTFIINDIKNSNAKHKDVRSNSVIQKFIFNILYHPNSAETNVNLEGSDASKIALDILTELYKKGVWDDAKTVNAIANACFSNNTKVMIAGLAFFLGRDEDEMRDENSDTSEDEETSSVSRKQAKEAKMANKVNKKTRKRARIEERMDKRAAKIRKKVKVDPFNTKALHLIYDPQKMAERLLALLSDKRELKRIDIKLMLMNLISRLVGVHQLYLFNLYPLLQRYLEPKQKEVTKILTYTAQACHEMVPADVLQPVLRTVVDNFVSDRNSSECITVGLNTVREMSSRCPAIMQEELLHDLAQYQKYRDKNVTSAARSLIQLFRIINPSLLLKKDRGRPKKKPVAGEDDAVDGHTDDSEQHATTSPHATGNHQASDDDDDDDAWDDVADDADESQKWQEDSDDDHCLGEGSECDTREETFSEDTPSEDGESDHGFSGEDDDARKGQHDGEMSSQLKRGRDVKSRRLQSEGESESDEELDRPEIVSLKKIEKLYKRSKADKYARMQSVEKGREGREKINPFAEKREKDKRRTKLFNMVKFKARAKNKRSFKDKQASLRSSLLKRMKRIK